MENNEGTSSAVFRLFRQIGWVVIRGQTLVLVLTLVVAPVTYTLFDELREKRLVVRGVRWFRSRLPAAEPVTPL